MNRSLTLKSKQQLVLNSELELGESEGKGKGRYFTSRFLEPGIAHYEELGDILITKETLNKFVHTMVGAPVIIDHEDVTDKNVDKLRVGVISRVWFNEFDGWFYCEGILTDNEAIDLIKNQGWNVSCAYSFESVPKDMHNGKKIDLEFIDGEFLHLAIVKNPRYEGANIVVNSKIENEDIERKRVPAGSPKGGQYASEDSTEQKKEDNRSFKNYAESLVKQAKISGIEDLKESKDGYQISFTIPQENYNARSKKLFEILKSSPKIESYDDFNVTDKSNRKGIFIQFKKPSAENNIGDITMSVLNDLTDFIKSVVKNEKEEEMTVKNEDKRKLIDEIGGILKDKVDDEIIRTVIKKAEELSYEPSEDDKADNKAKNEDDDEAKNKCKNEEDKKEEDKKADNEDDEEDEKVTENEDEEEEGKKEDKAENKKVKNSMKDIVMGGNGQAKEEKLYISRKERLEEGNKY